MISVYDNAMTAKEQHLERGGPAASLADAQRVAVETAVRRAFCLFQHQHDELGDRAGDHTGKTTHHGTVA